MKQKVELGGLKLSMFDISEPTDVKEIAKKIYGENKYSNSDAEYDRKAITIDINKNLIGFMASSFNEKDYKKYLVYGFDKDKGFYERFSFDFSDIQWYYGYNCRGVYIGDYFYIVPANIDRVISFDLRSNKLVNELEY